MSRPPWSEATQAQQRWSGWRFEAVRPASPQGGLRIGDAERDAASKALGDHYAAGRLSHAELDERTSAAWAARTRADLAPLFADLPPPHGEVLTGAPAPSQPGRRRARRGFPWLLWIAAVIVLSMVTNVPWILWAVGLWLLLSKVRHWGHPHRTPRSWPHGSTGPWMQGPCGRG
jgi:hypothetical protein